MGAIKAGLADVLRFRIRILQETADELEAKSPAAGQHGGGRGGSPKRGPAVDAILGAVIDARTAADKLTQALARHAGPEVAAKRGSQGGPSASKAGVGKA